MKRTVYLHKIDDYLRVFPVCAILGARQTGKTTLARQFAQGYGKKVEFFDLENPIHLASLDTPLLTLRLYHDVLVVIDEIQRRPELFPLLRVLVDDPDKKYQFLILGSASPDLIHQSSETLTGRIGYIELPPFSLCEGCDSSTLLVRGGFPRSYLAESDSDSFLWRENYIMTFLERDLPRLGFDSDARLMYRFWMMLCFYHGQQLNARELAAALMLSDKTITRYCSILMGTFMVRILQPWHENIKRRQVKTPKIYIRDTGIFNVLSSIRSLTDIAKTPKIGALWEGFALEQIINCLQVRSEDCYFWATHTDAEIDLLVFKNGKRLGFECKYTDNPKLMKSLYTVQRDLALEHVYLIFPGTTYFVVDKGITVCGLDIFKDKVVRDYDVLG